MNNWYIRFNRDRFKGVRGVDDTVYALNTLFEALLTFNLALAPFAPFITEKIYGLLLQYLQPEVDLQGLDKRSVHFQSFPEVNSKYIDENIERRVKRMQAVIDLVRVSRERRAINLKMPLKQLVVVHPDAEYIADIMSLQIYIVRELNVQNLVATCDERKYEIKYTLTVDWPTLGKKLRGDVKRVRDALVNLSSDASREMVQKQEFIVDGICLDAEDVTVKREFENIPATFEPNGNGNLLTLLDVESSAGLYLEGLCRDVISRFQKLRKRAGLLATQDVLMEYQIANDAGEARVSELFSMYRESMGRTLRGSLQEYGDQVPSTRLILEEEHDIEEAILRLRLVRLQ
jgi:isoleucyl-tRNA synthetase